VFYHLHGFRSDAVRLHLERYLSGRKTHHNAFAGAPMSTALPLMVNGVLVEPDTTFVDPAPTPAPTVRGFTDTDIANAIRLGRQHGGNIRFTSAAGWLVYDGKRWREDDRDVRIQALAKSTALSIYDEIKTAPNQDEMLKHAKRSQGKSAIEAMISLARSEPGVYMALTAFDADPFLLNVLNGTLDLRTGKLREHSREDYVTKLVPVKYDATAQCDLWHRFLERITDNNAELYDYLRRLVGYLLTGLTTEQVLHFLFGLGANGKSVFIEVVSSLLGDYAVICSPDLIMLKRHAGIPNDVARDRKSVV
jgi:putative DNA primase/helicase